MMFPCIYNKKPSVSQTVILTLRPVDINPPLEIVPNIFLLLVFQPSVNWKLFYIVLNWN